MSAGPDFARALARQLWDGPLPDVKAPQAAVSAMLTQGARHRDIAVALRALWRAQLPGAEAANAACKRWQGSVEMAALACDLAPSEGRDRALARLERRIAQVGGDRAVLARVHLRAGDDAAARLALADVAVAEGNEPAIALRARLAMTAGEFDAAARDLTVLGSARSGLAARLVWLRGGAAALDRYLAHMRDPAPDLWPEVFDIRLSERDFSAAAQALAAWQAAVSDDAPLWRAQARLVLERGSADAVELVAARLDPAQPSVWAAQEHALWLRAALAQGRATGVMAAHADAACRLHPRHHGLAHLALMIAEAVTDWRALDRGQGADDPARAVVLGRAALRLGCTGRASVLLAGAARRARGSNLARLLAARAEALMSAGRPQAAAAALARAEPLAVTAPARADLALLRAELALWQRDPAAGLAALAPVADAFPARMPLWLLAARLHFAARDPQAAQAALDRFAMLKRAQTGTDAPPDLRDLIVADALNAGDADPAASPGPAAAHVGARDWPFVPAAPLATQIPQRIAHYWEGAQSPALPRALARWSSLHPGYAQTLYDATSARDWLRAHHGAAMADRFAALPATALRADLFRLCLILTEGGVFADLDEYPRVPVTSWLDGARVVLCIERGFGTVANNFLAACPAEPVFARALDYVCTALDRTPTPYAWWDSGPAQLTRAVAAEGVATPDSAPRPGLRLLSQAEYCRRVSTNLPWPHKRGPDHWRATGAVDSDGAFS